MTPLISLKNIQKQYVSGHANTPALKPLSLNIYPNDMLAIVGASGSGKSTLMHIIGLLDGADQGKYLLKGHDVSHFNDDERAYQRNRNIGFVFQQFHLLPRLNVLQNVALPLHYRDMKTAEIEEKVMAILQRVDMAHLAHRLPNQLSGGQQQRVAIARALIGTPEVILADEPTGALDSKTGQIIMDLFLSLHAEGRTIVIVTHDAQIAQQCVRKISLADGSIVKDLGA